MLGRAAVAMWWDIAPEMKREFEHWHSREHMPERLAIPGFRRGTRWKSIAGADSYFVLYEARSLATISAGPYLDRLNDPTAWSLKIMPHHLNMVRSLCRVRFGAGAFIARALLTVRLSSRPRRVKGLTRALCDELLPAVAARAEMVGAHLLESSGAAGGAMTTEQRIRGRDATADRVLLISSYDADALEALAREELGEEALIAHGATAGSIRAIYTPALSLVYAEVAPA
jgi:hypothetical protein